MLRVCWVPMNYKGSSASIRITIWNISQYLSKVGSNYGVSVSDFVEEKYSEDVDYLAEKYDILVTNKMGYCPKNKIKIRFIDDSINFTKECISRYDAVVSTSNYHSQNYMRPVVGDKAFVIEEALETPIELCKIHSDVEKPRIVWCGSSGNVTYVQDVLDKIKSAGYNLDIIAGKGYGNVEWSLETVWDNIVKNDIAIVPSIRGIRDGFDFEAKTSGRIAMYMALGVPVIATPLPSAMEIISPGINGCFANSIEEFLELINVLSNKKLRIAVSDNAREMIYQNHSVEFIANQWVNLFNKLLKAVR